MTYKPSRYAFTHHFHRCVCGYRWGHDLPDRKAITTEEYHERHNCPECGINVRGIDGFEDWEHQLGYAAEMGHPLARLLAKERTMHEWDEVADTLPLAATYEDAERIVKQACPDAGMQMRDNIISSLWQRSERLRKA